VYVRKDPLKDDYTYIPDQLKTGQNWFGKSTYGEFFNNPNPEYFAKKVSVVEKLEGNPDYSRQYGIFVIIQKRSIKMISSPRLILFVQLKFTYKQKPKVISEILKTISHKILISNRSHLSFRPLQSQNIHSFD